MTIEKELVYSLSNNEIDTIHNTIQICKELSQTMRENGKKAFSEIPSEAVILLRDILEFNETVFNIEEED